MIASHGQLYVDREHLLAANVAAAEAEAQRVFNDPTATLKDHERVADALADAKDALADERKEA